MKNTPSFGKLFSDNIVVILSFVVFLGFTIWWLLISPFNPTPDTQPLRDIWGGAYQIMAYWGGIIGLIIASRWGGWKSLIGRIVLAFSIGLLLQGFGQTVYTYYLFHYHIQAPYPSLGDVGFFGTLPLYFIGGYLLTNLSAVKSRFQALGYKLFFILIPFLVLLGQYFLILRDYTFDWTNKMKIFLDLGYPMGDALVISIAILAFLLSLNAIGGIMKKPIIFLICALFIQYIADIYFFYQANQGTFFAGGFTDFLYFFSYTFMTLSIILIGETYKHIKSS